MLCSLDQRPQRRIMVHHMQLFQQPVEAPHVSGTMGDRVNNHSGVNEMKVDDKVEMILNVWKLEMRKV